MCWNDATFMLYVQMENTIRDAINFGLDFKVASMEELQDRLDGRTRM